MKRLKIQSFLLLFTIGAQGWEEWNYCTNGVKIEDIFTTTASMIWRNTSLSCDFFQLNVTSMNHSCNQFIRFDSIAFQRVKLANLCENSLYVVKIGPKARYKNRRIFTTTTLYFRTLKIEQNRSDEKSQSKENGIFQSKRNQNAQAKQKKKENTEKKEKKEIWLTILVTYLSLGGSFFILVMIMLWKQNVNKPEEARHPMEEVLWSPAGASLPPLQQMEPIYSCLVEEDQDGYCKPYEVVTGHQPTITRSGKVANLIKAFEQGEISGARFGSGALPQSSNQNICIDEENVGFEGKYDRLFAPNNKIAEQYSGL